MSERNQDTARCSPEELRQTISIHTKKITDACRDKDCIEDLRVYLTTSSQSQLDTAAGAKVRCADLLYAYIDVEPVAFDRNHYCIDITFYYRILADAIVGTARPVPLNGLVVFSKRVVLCGEDSRAHIFIYKRWKDKSGISVKEFLTYAIENGWIAAGFIDSEQGYFTTDEMFVLLIENIEKKIADDNEFEKILFKWLLFEDRIKGSDICRLLYDQQILSVADDDYEKLVSGQIDAFSFMKKKIEQLEITPAQLALDPCSASAVVVQQETGKILALVSYPGYDNNRLANQMDSAYYNRLLNDKALPLYNRATQQLTAPGSTFKPITVIAGLQERVISPDSSVLCDGVFDKVFPNLKCWKHTGHGNVINASTALQYSCNDYLCDIAYRLGTINGMEYTDNAALESLQEYSKLFYLDKKSGVEIAESQPHVTDAYGIPSAIGQGTHNYATVQLVRYVNTIASRGNVFQLSLVKGIADTNGNFVENNAVLENKVELPDSVWDTVSSGMVQFAQNNSVLRDMEISIAGKTGTAQESKSRPDHALFVGYAPAETPEITIAVRIANGYGSSNSTAVGKDIFNYYFGLENQEKIVTGEASQAFNTRTD